MILKPDWVKLNKQFETTKQKKSGKQNYKKRLCALKEWASPATYASHMLPEATFKMSCYFKSTVSLDWCKLDEW